MGAVHLHKYRTSLCSHRLSVDVTQVEEIVSSFYKVEMCFVDTTRLCSKNTDVRYAWIITYSRQEHESREGYHSDQTNSRQVHLRTNDCQINQLWYITTIFYLVPCRRHNYWQIGLPKVLGTCPKTSMFYGSNFKINGQVNHPKCCIFGA